MKYAVLAAAAIAVAGTTSASADEAAIFGGSLFAETVQSEPLIFINGEQAPNRSGAQLRRRLAGVEVELYLADLNPDAYYSVWWFVFNDPSRCGSDPCAAPGDVIGGAGQAFNAGGFISGADGTANVDFTLRTGPIPSGVDRVSRAIPPVGTSGEVGLRRPKSADIRVLVRAHGAVGGGDPVAQMTLFDGGCPGFPAFAGCEDQQLAIFPAPLHGNRRYRLD